MSEERFAVRSARSARIRFLTAALIVSMLTVSTPAAPQTIVRGISKSWQEARFAVLSSGFLDNIPNFRAAFLSKRIARPHRSIEVSRIRIFPGALSIRQGQETVLSAIAYDRDNEPLSGIAFEWWITDVGRKRAPRRLLNSTFKAKLPGMFTIQARVGSVEADIPAVVTPFRNPIPASAQVHSVSTRSGRRILQTSTGTSSNKEDLENNQSRIDLTRAELLPGDGWDSTNWPSSDDPGNQTGNPPGGPADDGAGSGNFQLSAPVIALPGRGIDLALNLNYNSRVWNKSSTQLKFDIDRGDPAPGWSLGFGKIVYAADGGCMLVDADGTRHGYTGSITQWSTGMTFTGHTADGSLIDYGCEFSYGIYGAAWAKLPNGTSISYSTIGATFDQTFPTTITDAQGNYISITYRNPERPQLETITDTLGRVITFQYDSLNRLISVTAPRMENEEPIYGGGKTRVVMRLHYRTLNLNYSFAAGVTPVVGNPSPYVIDAIYYPATNTGYWFNDSDSYSTYGMITKVVEQRGMTWTAGPDAQGTVTPGTMTKQASYNYPLTTANQTGRTNGINLTDAPTYTSLTESWDGRDVAEDAVTLYSINESDWHWDGFNNSPSRTITVTQPSGVISKQYTYRSGIWNEGLVFADDTISGSTVVASSLVAWEQGLPSETTYDAPRPNWVEVTDENGHKVKTDYSYAGGKFNQVTGSCDYDNASTLLRCATAAYENGVSYIGQFDANGKFLSGRHIFNLITNSGVQNPSGTRVSYTEYEYDNYQAQPFTDTPGVIQHLDSHNVFSTSMQDGPTCLEWGPYYECLMFMPPPGCRDCLEYEQVPVYDPATDKRGNVTKVTTYADAQNLTGAIVETRGYDITGNLVKSSSACCEQTSISYEDPLTLGIDTQYAYPVSQTRGASDPNSPHRITTTAVYDFETGLLKQTTDANGRTSTNWYNPDTLRPVRTDLPTGAYSTIAYDDAAMTITEEAREANATLASKSKKYLNGIGLVRKTEDYAPNSVIDITETKYTKFAEAWKQSRPYRAGDTVQWSEKFYDAQRRLIKIVEPDGSETKAFYNEPWLPDSVTSQPGNRIRVIDAWGRERWGRYDQQGRLVQVVEPNPDGTVNPTGSVYTAAGSLLTKYKFDTLGRLIETEQGSQFRKFRYDDLGRLTRQKLAEQTATLNDAGQYIGANQTGANWSEAFTFDNRSNITLKTDARGVRTYFSYQLTGGGDDPLNRLQSRWYDQSGPLDPGLTIHAAPSVSYSYVSSGDKTRIAQIRTDGLLTEDFLYDAESRVSEYKQTVDYRANYAMKVNYLYDSLDRIKEITYPAQYGPTGGGRKIVAHTYDSASRLTTLKYGTATSMTDQAGNIDYNASDQTTEIKIGEAGANQVTENYTFDPTTGLLTNQKASRNGTDLLNLSYEYNRNNSVGNLNGKTGHLTKIVDNLNSNKNREYEFDAVGRLTKAKGGPTGNLWTQSYSYDRYGNRTNVTATGVAADNSAIPRDGIATLAYSSTSNRITTAGWEYDSAGNQTRALAEDGVTWLKFEYDAANRIRIVKKDDANQTLLQAFQYGSTNARLMDYDAVAGVNKLYASTGGTVLAEYTEFQAAVPTWTKSYTYLGDTQLATITPNGTNENMELNHPDRLGARVITNQQTGSSTEQAHLPFGTALNAESSVTNNNKRFTSYDRSALTGIDYAVNRNYDSKQGRFTQVDPIGMQAASLVSPQTLNLYTYCGNDPINHTDPSGLFFGKLFRWISKALKWIMLAVAIAVAILTIVGNVLTPIAFAAFMKSTLGQVLGFIAGIPGLVGNFISGLPKMISGIFSFLSDAAASAAGANAIGWGVLAGTSAAAGAIGNHLDKKKKKETKEQRRKRLIKSAVNSALWRLANMPGCKTFIQEEFNTHDPETVLKTIYADGNIQPNNLPSPPVAQSPPAGAGSGGTPTYLSDEWFDGQTVGGWTSALGMNQTNVRTLVLLHELKHRIGTDHSSTAPDGTLRDDSYFNKGIAKHCFGVNV